MRILGFPMRIVILGNANSVNVRNWQQGLAEAGAEVYLLSTHIDHPLDDHTLPLAASPLPDKLRYFAAAPAARRLIPRLHPDLVIGYFVTGYGTLATLTGFHPLVQATAGDDILLSPKKPILRRLVRLNLQRADLITVWAPHMTEAVKALGFYDEKIFTLPRGVPLELFADQPPAPPSPSFRLISTRSLSSVYRIDQIIEAIRLLRDRGLDCSLTVAGTGSEQAALESLAQRLGLSENVRFTGWIPNEKLPPLLAQHDGYIAAINTDGVSASLLEAMAVGLLPIVPDNPANRNWIDPGHNGLLDRGGDAGGNRRCGCPSCRRPRPARARRHNQPSAGLRARGPARQLAALPRPLRPIDRRENPVGHGAVCPAPPLTYKLWIERDWSSIKPGQLRALARRRTARSRPARVAAAPA